MKTRTGENMTGQTWTGLAQHGVTIAISSSNHELLLPRVVDSALQAVAHLRDYDVPSEVLVIDNGSRDGSLVLLRHLEALYYREGLHVLFLADGSGIPAGRNLALAGARYRYLAFLDANKELISENLPTFLRALQETGATAVYGNVLMRTPASRCAMNLLSNESVQTKLFQSNYIDALSLIDRSQLFDLGGPDSYQTLDTHQMWLHLAVNGRKIVFVPLAFGYHYVLPGSTAAEGVKEKEAERQSRQIHDPLPARAHLPMNAKLLRFHPALGYC